ncbi:hypothetical protein SLEP1_g3482 [Rubroshorea leprosula]|uniref:Transposase n=1 Tax=Rubroshorea leprosula TaxID=152421 RepID=A0AAV5HV48_9ROSI|nr:hypothetical protein SLEP1_g3482 [Rubroshorea leprosula]
MDVIGDADYDKGALIWRIGKKEQDTIGEADCIL